MSAGALVKNLVLPLCTTAATATTTTQPYVEAGRNMIRCYTIRQKVLSHLLYRGANEFIYIE